MGSKIVTGSEQVDDVIIDSNLLCEGQIGVFIDRDYEHLAGAYVVCLGERLFYIKDDQPFILYPPTLGHRQVRLLRSDESITVEFRNN